MISLFLKTFHTNRRHIFVYLRLALYIGMTVLYIRYIWLFSILIKLSGDVKRIRVQNLSHFKASQSVTGT